MPYVSVYAPTNGCGSNRFEVNAWKVTFLNAVVPGRRRRLRALRAQRRLLVNVACGPQLLDGFVNIELLGPLPRLLWDCRRNLPLADDSAAGIRVEQFVEHIETREACFGTRDREFRLDIDARQ